MKKSSLSCIFLIHFLIIWQSKVWLNHIFTLEMSDRFTFLFNKLIGSNTEHRQGHIFKIIFARCMSCERANVCMCRGRASASKNKQKTQNSNERYQHKTKTTKANKDNRMPETISKRKTDQPTIRPTDRPTDEALTSNCWLKPQEPSHVLGAS